MIQLPILLMCAVITCQTSWQTAYGKLEDPIQEEAQEPLTDFGDDFFYREFYGTGIEEKTAVRPRDAHEGIFRPEETKKPDPPMAEEIRKKREALLPKMTRIEILRCTSGLEKILQYLDSCMQGGNIQRSQLKLALKNLQSISDTIPSDSIKEDIKTCQDLLKYTLDYGEDKGIFYSYYILSDISRYIFVPGTPAEQFYGMSQTWGNEYPNAVRVRTMTNAPFVAASYSPMDLKGDLASKRWSITATMDKYADTDLARFQEANEFLKTSLRGLTDSVDATADPSLWGERFITNALYQMEAIEEEAEWFVNVLPEGSLQEDYKTIQMLLLLFREMAQKETEERRLYACIQYAGDIAEELNQTVYSDGWEIASDYVYKGCTKTYNNPPDFPHIAAGGLSPDKGRDFLGEPVK